MDSKNMKYDVSHCKMESYAIWDKEEISWISG